MIQKCEMLPAEWQVVIIVQQGASPILNASLHMIHRYPHSSSRPCPRPLHSLILSHSCTIILLTKENYYRRYFHSYRQADPRNQTAHTASSPSVPRGAQKTFVLKPQEIVKGHAEFRVISTHQTRSLFRKIRNRNWHSLRMKCPIFQDTK